MVSPPFFPSEITTPIERERDSRHHLIPAAIHNQRQARAHQLSIAATSLSAADSHSAQEEERCCDGCQLRADVGAGGRALFFKDKVIEMICAFLLVDTAKHFFP